MGETLYTQLQRLQKNLNIPPLPKDEMGNFLWFIDEKNFVTLGENEEEYTFSSSFAPCPKSHKEEFYLKALRGNLFGQGTQGAVLGLTSDGERVLLQDEVSKDLGYEEFEASLEEFLNTIEIWRDEVAHPESPI